MICTVVVDEELFVRKRHRSRQARFEYARNSSFCTRPATLPQDVLCFCARHSRSMAICKDFVFGICVLRDCMAYTLTRHHTSTPSQSLTNFYFNSSLVNTKQIAQPMLNLDLLSF